MEAYAADKHNSSVGLERVLLDQLKMFCKGNQHPYLLDLNLLCQYAAEGKAAPTVRERCQSIVSSIEAVQNTLAVPWRINFGIKYSPKQIDPTYKKNLKFYDFVLSYYLDINRHTTTLKAFVKDGRQRCMDLFISKNAQIFDSKDLEKFLFEYYPRELEVSGPLDKNFLVRFMSSIINSTRSPNFPYLRTSPLERISLENLLIFDEILARNCSRIQAVFNPATWGYIVNYFVLERQDYDELNTRQILDRFAALQKNVFELLPDDYKFPVLEELLTSAEYWVRESSVGSATFENSKWLSLSMFNRKSLRKSSYIDCHRKYRKYLES